MDRMMVWPGAIPLETDILSAQKNTMIGIAKLAHAILGDGPWLTSLGCVPTSPASMQVSVGAGQIYSLQNIDGTAFSSLAADTTHQILKQGILLDPVTLSCPAPATAGQSINYLVQVAYQDVDGGSTVLPYYNASNPAQAYSGPNNSGTANYTVRQGKCIVAVKAGTSAATGSQVTPAADAGYIGAWVVTVANGATTITSGNIAIYLNAPFLPNTVIRGIQTFTASGTFTVPVGVTKIFVSACAGGAGGGGGGGTIGSASLYGGGGGAGGGAGQSIIRQMYSVTAGQSIAITIGAGGAGGTAGQGTGTNGGAGGAGGNTVIGALVTLTGASSPGGGQGMSASTIGAGGSFAAGYPAGNAGGDGAYAGLGGMGGSSPFGGGGGGGRASTATIAAQNGTVAVGYGSGGGGAGGSYGNNGGQASGPGGNGAPGIVIIEW